MGFVRWWPLQSIRAGVWLPLQRYRRGGLLSWSCSPFQGRFQEKVGLYRFGPAPLTFARWPTGPSLLRPVPSDRSPKAPSPPRVQLSFRVCSKPQPPNPWSGNSPGVRFPTAQFRRAGPSFTGAASPMRSTSRVWLPS